MAIIKTRKLILPRPSTHSNGSRSFPFAVHTGGEGGLQIILVFSLLLIRSDPEQTIRFDDALPQISAIEHRFQLQFIGRNFLDILIGGFSIPDSEIF